MMLEAIILLIVLTIGMAKKRGSRRRWGPNMFRARTGSANPLALGTLGDNSLGSDALFAVSANSFRAISLRLTWAMLGHTAGEGPIHVGVAHSDYTATEIEEWFEQTASIDQGNKIANEQSDRLCRMVGTFSGVSTDEVLNDGKPIHTKLNWNVREGQTINTWAFNDSGGPLTTGCVITPMGWLVGRYT